jgi:hypothetical protein
MELLASGGTTFKTMEATAMRTADVVGRIAEVDSLIDLLTEEDYDRDREDSPEGIEGT